MKMLARHSHLDTIRVFRAAAIASATFVLMGYLAILPKPNPNYIGESALPTWQPLLDLSALPNLMEEYYVVNDISMLSQDRNPFDQPLTHFEANLDGAPPKIAPLGPVIDPPKENETPVRQIKTAKVTLGRGDALIDLVTAQGISQQEAFTAIQVLGRHMNLRRLQIGQEITVKTKPPETGSRPQLEAIQIRTGFDQITNVERGEDGIFSASAVNLPSLTTTMFHDSTIDDSLFLAAERANIPVNIIIKLIRIFSFEVDFQRDVRPGDSFEVYYERRVGLENLDIENGDILFASMTLRGKKITYYRYEPTDTKRVGYFNEEGQSARRTLLKTPLDGARVITDNYGMRRHPVLGYNRMHKGLDFRAPTGTPILAAGDGVVERASRYGSYGNYVLIRHNDTYKTAYAHLSRYGRNIRAGARVTQGQIIGYSGATGRVTAAHLHYEVYVNGTQVNPSTLNLPTGRTLTGEERAAFFDVKNTISREIAFIASLPNPIETLTSP